MRSTHTLRFEQMVSSNELSKCLAEEIKDTHLLNHRLLNHMTSP